MQPIHPDSDVDFLPTQVVAPALQVVLSLAAQLPESAPVRGQAVDFVERHAVGLSRILDDATDGRRYVQGLPRLPWHANLLH